MGLAAWIIHGDADITVPYLHSERLAGTLTEKLGADKVSFELVSGMGHASDPLYAEEVLDRLDAFMKEHL
jgi:predicted esterase